ncbi:MAG: ATP-binding cassette domain-containing protein [Candidatus Eisenbacteria bacterium]|nr:ATP-binding cassette domain-containing protein [Candidatus Eisenbacteria bacterium]
MSILRTVDLRKTYRKGRVEIDVLRGLSFEVDEGEFLTVVGRSGSGKSTLLNLLGGLDSPTGGRIEVGGRDLSAMSRSELAHHRRETVGMIFQSFNLIPSRTALANVTLALAFGGCPRARRADRARELLETVGLAARVGHLPSELSGGEAQRVAIARAIANRPDVVLADEPTGNLDSRTAAEIVELLGRLNRENGVTIVMVSHDEAGARQVSDRILTLLDGCFVDRGEVAA